MRRELASAVLVDAERSVLGAVILRNEAIHHVNGLRPHHFFDAKNRAVFAAMLHLDASHSPIDAVTLEVELARADQLQAIGGLAYLSDLLSAVPTSDNIAFYADIVEREGTCRHVLDGLEEAKNLATHPNADRSAVVQRLKEVIGELEQPAGGSTPASPDTAAAILRSKAFAEPQRTYSTGFLALDRLLDGGVKARQLTVFAAPTGAGKTGLALTLARTLDLPILYVTAELDTAEIAARSAAPVIGVRPGEILAHTVPSERAACALDELPIHVLDLDGIAGAAAIAKIREAAVAIRDATGMAPAILVDYLQLLAVDASIGDSPRMGITLVTLELRRLARAFNVPIVAISSVSRAYYGASRASMASEEDPRAWLAAAKDDGNIEYTAAVFMYLDTSPVIDATGTSAARLIVAKSRGGVPGFVYLRFHGPSGGFTAAETMSEYFGPARRTRELHAKIIAAVSAATFSRAPTVKELKRLVSGFRKDDIAAAAEELVLRGELLEASQMRLNKRKHRYNATVLIPPKQEEKHAVDDS